MRKQDRILQQQSQAQQAQTPNPGSKEPVKAQASADHLREVPRQPGKLPLPE